MMNYPISPDHAFIVKAFSEAESLRGAALLLNIDPAQLARKVQKIALEGLIQKMGNRWVVTEKGRRVALWVDESIIRQKILIEERPTIRIASYTWLAEQMLIPRFKELKKMTESRYTWNFNVVATNLEEELITSRADFVLTCHSPNDPLIAQKKFAPDPWYIIAPPEWKKDLSGLKGEELQNFLDKRPFIRIASLHPDQTLGFSPKMNADLLVEGVIGVRAAVKSGIGWGCIPGLSIMHELKSQDLLKVDLPSKTRGDLSLWWMRSRKDAGEYVKILSRWMKP